MGPRVRKLNDQPERRGARYVLYWAQTSRRADANHGLAFTIETANRCGLPVLVYEGLTCDFPLATNRVFTFLLENVPEMEQRLKQLGLGYCFYLKQRRNSPNNVLYRLAEDAAAVVTDDYPAFLARHHNARVPARLDVACYAVDSACVVPMGCFERREYAAYTIRPKIRKLLPDYLRPFEIPEVRRRWQGPPPVFHTPADARNAADLAAGCDIDQSVGPSLSFRGGRNAALRRLEYFLEHNLRRYGAERNNPSNHATSGLSPYLRYGFIGALEVALAVKSYGEAHGIATEEFLEELIVRRELAFNFARHSADPASLDNLPEWALRSLRAHDRDRRDPCYSREQFENAATHDALWNATQNEMRLRGKIHGYYRMYWGKKIIEWARSHQEAVDVMVYLHDKYALDGRDPNTYTGILWCLGLHDRPWAERPIFGTVRYMSLDGMKRKTDVESYVKEIQYLERLGKDPHRIQ